LVDQIGAIDTDVVMTKIFCTENREKKEEAKENYSPHELQQIL